jgi:hypothetical protein
MPVLPSFIHKGKRKFKVPTKYPFGTRRPNAPALASTGIIDVLDQSTSQFAEGDEEFVSRGSLDFDNDEHRYHYEPLDLNISPEPLMSSFPSRFLKNSYIQPNNTTAPRIFNDGEEEDGDRLGSTSVDNDGLVEDDDADELIAKLQGMDVRRRSDWIGAILLIYCLRPLASLVFLHPLDHLPLFQPLMWVLLSRLGGLIYIFILVQCHLISEEVPE